MPSIQLPLRAVILDWAGTTVDYGSRAPTQVFLEIFRRRGIAITEPEARGPMGRSKREHIAAIAACRQLGLKIGSTTGYTRELMNVVAPLAAQQGNAPDVIVCSDDVSAGRPAPWMNFRAAERLGVFPMNSVLVVDDTPRRHRSRPQLRSDHRRRHPHRQLPRPHSGRTHRTRRR